MAEYAKRQSDRQTDWCIGASKLSACVHLSAGEQDHSQVECYRAGYLHRSTTAEKPTVTVLCTRYPCKIDAWSSLTHQ